MYIINIENWLKMAAIDEKNMSPGLCLIFGIGATFVTVVLAQCLPRKSRENFFQWKGLINGTTLFINLIAKAGSHTNAFDFPENILHLLSLAGGAPATALSMLLFHHKSTHTGYQQDYVTVCCGHVILEIVLMIFLFLRGWLVMNPAEFNTSSHKYFAYYCFS